MTITATELLQSVSTARLRKVLNDKNLSVRLRNKVYAELLRRKQKR